MEEEGLTSPEAVFMLTFGIVGDILSFVPFVNDVVVFIWTPIIGFWGWVKLKKKVQEDEEKRKKEEVEETGGQEAEKKKVPQKASAKKNDAKKLPPLTINKYSSYYSSPKKLLKRYIIKLIVMAIIELIPVVSVIPSYTLAILSVYKNLASNK